MKFDHFSGAVLGSRASQQDCCLHASFYEGAAHLLIIADGIGGYAGGAEASHLASHAFLNHFEHFTRGTIAKRLEISLAMANHAIAEHIRAHPTLDGMGTTLLAAFCDADGVIWTSVGDSPLLLVRNGAITRLNADHSMTAHIERQHAAGKLTRQEADLHPERGSLLSCLGGLYAPDLIDSLKSPVLLLPGDRLIAASDGLLELPMPKIANCLRSSHSAQNAVNAVVDALSMLAMPDQDNAALHIVCVEA